MADQPQQQVQQPQVETTQQTGLPEGQTGIERSGIPGVGQLDVLDEGQQQPEGQQPAGQQQQAPEGQQLTSLTRDDITEILREAGLGAQQAAAAPQAAAQPQRQWTQAEYEQAFQVFKPDAALVAQLRDEDSAVALSALQKIQDGLIRQAMTMADYRMQQIRDQLFNEHIQPIQSAVSEQVATAWRSDFFKQYPDLEPYEVIVDAVAARLRSQGYQGASRADVMKKFADDAKSVVQTLLAGQNGGQGAGQGQQQQRTQTGAGQQRQQQQRRMSTLSTGGQGGQSRPGATQTGPKGPAGIEVFE